MGDHEAPEPSGTPAAQEASIERRRILARLRERITLPGLESWSTTVRTVMLNALFLAALIVLLPVLVSQFRRDQVIIEPIAVPGALADEGLTADVAASRLWDGLLDVTKKARTAKASITALPDSRRVEFSFPDSGFSIESLIFHVRKLFNAYETRIAGEFTCSDADCSREGMRLRLRVIRDHVDIIDLPPIKSEDERDYFADAASGVLSVLDPFVAIAASADTDPLHATILARRLIRSHHPDSHWAHNLIGNIRSRASDLPGAIAEYRAALALKPDFLIARGNLADALRQSGDAQAARAEYDKVFRADPNYPGALEGTAELALADGDADKAIGLMLKAADADPLSPRYLARAGKIAMDAGKSEDARRYLGQALEIDPGYLPAFAFLAAMELADENYVAAEKIYRDAADYAPDDPEAQLSHGRILAIMKDWDGALVRFRRAVALAPDNADYHLQEARALQALERQDEALAALEEARRLAPDNGEVYLSLGDSFRDLDRKPEAVAAYRKFLELDKDSVMRPLAERFIQLLSG